MAALMRRQKENWLTPIYSIFGLVDVRSKKDPPCDDHDPEKGDEWFSSAPFMMPNVPKIWMAKHERCYFQCPLRGGALTTVARVVDATSDAKPKVLVSYSVEPSPRRMVSELNPGSYSI